MNRLTAFNMVVYAAVGLTFGFMTPGIDNFAHLGGWLAGVLTGVILILL
ncbi:MAG: rhomboid family intramembrane serine protease [Clostridiales bacterium]|jgi:membrane associated rhomboid family serine protease|nr:rhomboid family intramembrane serine protease [Clostridiales bacterium]